jgi:hypothetical protein
MPSVLYEVFVGRKDAVRINIEELIDKYADVDDHALVIDNLVD